MSWIISVDPGKKKCGVLLADLDTNVVLDGRVVVHSSVLDLIINWTAKGNITCILLGNGTGSQYWHGLLKDLAPIQIIDETGSTLRARERYWELWPPVIWLRWVPRGLMIPPNHLDAVAALVLLEDRFEKKLHWPGPINFRIWPEL